MQIVDEDHPDASRRVVGGFAGRQDDAFHRGRRGGRFRVVDAPAVREDKGHQVLLHPVFVHVEIALLEIRDEYALVVADDDVGRDDVEAPADNRSLVHGSDDRLVWRRLLSGRRLGWC